jgi:hypothetical protein
VRSVTGYSPDINDETREAKESVLLEVVATKRLLETLQAGEGLACNDL